VTSTDSGLRTVGHSAAELAAEWEQQATERVADLQHVVAMLLEKNEKLRQQLAAREYLRP
jgi:hypothetical protein